MNDDRYEFVGSRMFETSNLPESKQMIVGFTGHRPQRIGEKKDWVIRELRQVIYMCVVGSDIPVIFVSGGALGVDQWAADEVIFLKSSRLPGCRDFRKHEVRLVIARPFPSQDMWWTLDQKIGYNRILDLADEVVTVSPDPYASHKYHVRDKWIVDHSDLLVAVWDGEPGGGTAATVRLAQRANKPIVHINPATLVTHKPYGDGRFFGNTTP